MTMSDPQSPTETPPDDLVGTKFLGSIGWAVWFAFWGAALGCWVEAAVNSGPEARLGALLAAAVLTACAAAVAFGEGRKHGVKEAAGRALREALNSSWRGAWLGGLIGGGLAAGGGGWMLTAVLAAVAAGGVIGLAVGRRRHGPALAKALNTALSVALLGGFVAAAWWGAPGTPTLNVKPAEAAAGETTAGDVGAPPAAADPVAASPTFGPSADWAWRTAGAVPLALVAAVWWVGRLREDGAKEKDQALGRGWGVAALFFVAAMAAGLGAIAGAGAQWACGQLVLGGGLTPTPGKWAGACLALLSWGLRQQPVKPAAAA
jgi:hypothetical protein